MKFVGKISVFVCLLMLAATPSAVGSEPLQGIFTEYGSLDGMAHNNIHDIHIDRQGYVWLCTWSGVSRFDGYHFKNYCTNPKDMPVRHNRFRSVDEDAKGNLWFRTYDDHIYRFDPRTEIFEDVCHSIPQLEGKSYRTDKFVCSPESHTVWVEYQGFGLVGFVSNDDNELQTLNLIDSPAIGRNISLMVAEQYGTLWVASEQGNLCVVESDGSRVNIVVNPEGCVRDMVVADGKVFYATDNSIGVVEREGNQTPRNIPFSHDNITSLCWDGGSNKLYIGTANKGLYAILPNGNIDHYTAGDTPRGVRQMQVDSHGTVWITSTRGGITRLDPARKDYKHFHQEQNTVQFYADNTSMVKEKGDVVWIKMNHVGFGYYDRQKDSVEPFYNDLQRPDFRISNGVAIFDIDDNNVLWLSTYYERGLRRVVLQREEKNLLGLGNSSSTIGSFLDEARALKLDHRGNLWVGTKEGHLYCYNEDYQPLHHINCQPSGAPLGAIYTIEEDSHGNLWVGTKGDGVYRLTPRGNEFEWRTYRHNPDDPHSLSNDQVYSIEEDNQGRIWMATFGGAINMLGSADEREFANTTNSFPHYPTETGSKARYLLADSNGRMLLGTSEGLIIFNPSESPEKMTFRVAHRGFSKDALQAGDVLHIFEGKGGNVWLSTYGGGLSRIVEYDRNGTPLFETFTTADGLPSNVVMAATEDEEGNLWLSSERGVAKFSPTEHLVTSYTRYDGYKPVVYNEATVAIDRKGNVVMGAANNCVQVIDPKSEENNSYDYNLHFTSVEVQNRGNSQNNKEEILHIPTAENSVLNIDHDYLMFHISFSALNFRLHDRVSYMYLLEGYDEEWRTTSGVNNVYYSKVPHGHYTFRVKAYVGNPQLASPEISLPIHIATPPWASWWAITIYVLLAAGVLVVAFGLYLRFVKLRNTARLEQDMTEMKLKFFTNISHELRTPLTLIMGGIEDVQRHEELSERGEGSLQLSHKNAKRMLTLINQLLDFRKIVKEKMELRVERLDMVALARDVVEDFRESAAEKQIELFLSSSHNSIYLWCDSERIESLLYNLLSNAIKFTRTGGRITVAVAGRDEDPFTTITVSDTGIGIPKERLGDIFDRFASYASAVRGEVSGTGIGLALCKEIVELHHGTLTVESKVGQGTTFTATLLRGNSHFSMEQIVFGDNPALEEQRASSRREGVCPPAGAKRIVLAEDNSEMRAFLYNNLVDAYEVIEAVDGVEALEMIKAHQPDIIITDLMMPRMDGLELVEQVRGDFEISHIPIVMLTAKQTPQDRILALKYGADGYITKPFSMEHLLVRIDNLLTQRRILFEKLSHYSATNRAPLEVEMKPREVVVTNRDEEFLSGLMEWLEENIDNSELTIDQLAGHLKLGRTTMYNKIKSLTGKSPVELIKEYRITKSELLLRTGQFSVSEVAYKVGFTDPGYFSRCFKEQYKSAPVEYLRKLGIKV